MLCFQTLSHQPITKKVRCAAHWLPGHVLQACLSLRLFDCEGEHVFRTASGEKEGFVGKSIQLLSGVWSSQGIRIGVLVKETWTSVTAETWTPVA